MFHVETQGETISIFLEKRKVLFHAPDDPFIHAAKGKWRLETKDTDVSLADSLSERTALTKAQYDAGRSTLRLSGGDYSLTFHLSDRDGNLVLTPQRATTGLNRLQLSFPVGHGACIYGGGAQYDTLDLRGRRIPLWVGESRVEGDDNFRLSQLRSARKGQSHFPLPAFVTEEFTYYQFDCGAYTVLDFRGSRHARAEFWDLPSSIVIGQGSSFEDVSRRMTLLSGRQAVLPAWCYEGALMEIQGGMQPLLDSLEKCVTAGAAVSALCIRDWSGFREAEGKRRVFYDWVWNRELYPRLRDMISELAQRGIRTVAYICPHFSIEGRLFAEASLRGYLIRKPQGGYYVTDMCGLMAGHLDMTNPDACAWMKDIIKENILGLGFCGAYADMGELLPADAVLHSGDSPVRIHNRWPVLWAKLNREAIREAGRTGDSLFLSRSGYQGAAGLSMLPDTGLHHTNWAASTGLPSALCASLSMSCSGLGLSYSEVGGNVRFARSRSRELFLRWIEYGAFTPMMRVSSAGGESWRFDSDENTLRLFARMSRVHAYLAPYLRACIRENASDGQPVMRPLFHTFPGDARLRRVKDAYMLGSELLCAPVLNKGQKNRSVYLPEGYWVHLWTGREYVAGETTVQAPFGKPPVFYRPSGKHAEHFKKLLQGQF